MKKLSVIILVILLSGCTNRLAGWELEQAIKTCQGADKIDSIATYPIDNAIVTCRDGNKYRTKGTDL